MPRYAKGSRMFGPATAAGKAEFVKATRQLARVAAGKKPRARPVASRGIVRAVKSVLARSEETKIVAENVIDRAVVGQAGTTPVGLQRLLPRMSQGTGDFQRIGEKVQPVKAQSCFTVYYDPENANNNDQFLHLWIVTVKGAQTAAAVAAIPAGNFLRVGDGTNVDPNNGDQTLMLTRYQGYELNRDQYTLMKHYKIRMRKGVGYSNLVPTSAGTIAPTGVVAKEEARQFTFTWKPPALKYNAAGDVLPSNHYPVCLYYATNADGSAYGDTIKINCFTKLFYKDA